MKACVDEVQMTEYKEKHVTEYTTSDQEAPQSSSMQNVRSTLKRIGNALTGLGTKNYQISPVFAASWPTKNQADRTYAKRLRPSSSETGDEHNDSRLRINGAN